MSQPEALANCFQHTDYALLAGVVNSKLERVRARLRRRFVDRQFTRIVLLVLHRRAHAVVAQTYGNRRGLLSHLKGAMAPLHYIWNRSVNPGIGNVVDRGADEIPVDVRGRHRGHPGEYRADQAIILHGRHVVVDLVGGNLALVVKASCTSEYEAEDCVDH